MELECTGQVIQQINSIINDKGSNSFDLINMFPAYLRTTPVTIKSTDTELDFTDGHLLEIELVGVKSVEKTDALGNKNPLPKDFNYLVIGTNRFVAEMQRSRERIIKEFPTTSQAIWTISTAHSCKEGFVAIVYEDEQTMHTFCKSNKQDVGRMLDEMVVFVGDRINRGGSDLVLLNPQTYHKNITTRYGKGSGTV